MVEKKIEKFLNSGIEWCPLNQIKLDTKQYQSAINFLEALDDDDDVQNVYTNLKQVEAN